MAKSKQEHSRFTEPEMEAALQLIQLSGESDVNSSGEVLTMKRSRRGKEVVVGVGDNDESQGSSTSDITSAPARFVFPRFEAEDDDDEIEDSDVVLVGGSRRRKRKKFRSVSEIYKICSVK